MSENGHIEWSKIIQGVILALLVAFVISGGVWIGTMQEQHAEFRADIESLRLKICDEENERRAEYMRLDMSLTGVKIELENLRVGQTWMIDRMKGE